MSDKILSAINAARKLVKEALQDTNLNTSFDIEKARRAAPSYWSSLDLESSKEQIQDILKTKAQPNTDAFYQAVYAYQMSKPSITLKDGILGPETFGTMIKNDPNLAKGFQSSQTKGFEDFLDQNKGLAQDQEGYNLQSFKDKIGQVESGGKYEINNPDPKSTATGKYQFVWSIWGKTISDFAGRPLTRDDFRLNPKLQEAFMDHYIKSTLIPGATSLRKRFPGPTSKMTPNQLLGLVHFKGAGDAAKILSGLPDPTTRGNLPVQQYLSKLV